MFQQINANWFLILAYSAALDYAQKAGLVTDEEGFRAYMNLPNATGGGDTTVEGVYNEIQGWTNRYAADQTEKALAPVLPFIVGGDYSGVPLVGFIPASEKFLSDLTDYAARNTVALFGVGQFGENPSEADAVALARTFIESDQTHVMLAAGVTGDAASVEVLAEGIGLTLPEVTTEDLAVTELTEAPATEETPAEEEQPVTEVPEVEVTGEATGEPAVAVVEEVEVSADLPALNQPVTGEVISGVSFQAALDLVDQVLDNNAQMLQMAADNTTKLRTAIKGFAPQPVEIAEVVEEQTA